MFLVFKCLNMFFNIRTVFESACLVFTELNGWRSFKVLTCLDDCLGLIVFSFVFLF